MRLDFNMKWKMIKRKKKKEYEFIFKRFYKNVILFGLYKWKDKIDIFVRILWNKFVKFFSNFFF